MTLAITIFTAVVAWLVPRDSNAVGTEFGMFRYSVCILLIFFEFALFLLSYHLTSMLRTITVYLDMSGASGWESDWTKYRSQFPRSWRYTKPQSVTFLIVGSLAGGLPFLFRLAFPIVLRPKTGTSIFVLVVVLYIIFVTGMGFFDWFAKEKELKRRWQTIKDKEQKPLPST